jgi:hypothetical protein
MLKLLLTFWKAVRKGSPSPSLGGQNQHPAPAFSSTSSTAAPTPDVALKLLSKTNSASAATIAKATDEVGELRQKLKELMRVSSSAR